MNLLSEDGTYFRTIRYCGSTKEYSKYLDSCISIDLEGFKARGEMCIWIHEKEIRIKPRKLKDFFSKEIISYLNAHYYDYVKHMESYLSHKPNLYVSFL